MLRALEFGFIVSLASVGAAFGAGSAPMTPPSTPPGAQHSPAEQAIEHYNSGLASRDDAWRYEKKWADAAPAERAKLETKIGRSFEHAVDELSKAVEADPSLHQAWSSLGYALRRTGDYDRALAAYDRALEIKPAYPEALEYRGEAYLALGRIEDAKHAHDELRTVQPKLADELLGAMRSWIAKRRTDPGEVGVGQLDELERWIDAQDRGELSTESSLRKTRGW